MNRTLQMRNAHQIQKYIIRSLRDHSFIIGRGGWEYWFANLTKFRGPSEVAKNKCPTPSGDFLGKLFYSYFDPKIVKNWVSREFYKSVTCQIYAAPLSDMPNECPLRNPPLPSNNEWSLMHQISFINI